MPLCRVINSLCFCVFFLEPSTLLHIRNLKSCSMGCLSLIVDWYTCHLLVLQVRRLNLTCMSLTLVKCNAIQFCAKMLSLIFVYNVDSFIIGCCYGITFICYCPGIILNILILLFCYFQLLSPTLWWTPSGWSRPGCSWRKSRCTDHFFYLVCIRFI